MHFHSWRVWEAVDIGVVQQRLGASNRTTVLPGQMRTCRTCDTCKVRVVSPGMAPR